MRSFLDLAFLSRRKFGRAEPPQCNGREETDYDTRDGEAGARHDRRSAACTPVSSHPEQSWNRACATAGGGRQTLNRRAEHGSASVTSLTSTNAHQAIVKTMAWPHLSS
jgi:hypothetical protein